MINKYVERLVKSLQDLPKDDILKAAEFITSMKIDNKVVVCGNGGDAALSDHFVVDLIKFAYIPAISICANQSMITMIGNDYEYKDIFSFQLSSLVSSGDILFCLSTSGESKNIINATYEVLGRNPIISVVGKKHDSYLKKVSNICIEISHLDGPMPIEDIQSVICHLITQEIVNLRKI